MGSLAPNRHVADPNAVLFVLNQIRTSQPYDAYWQRTRVGPRSRGSPEENPFPRRRRVAYRVRFGGNWPQPVTPFPPRSIASPHQMNTEAADLSLE